MKEAKTQAEFEALSKTGKWFCVTSGVWVARDSSYVVARDSSYVVARDSSHVEAWDSSHVEAWDSSHVVARGSSHVVARGSSHVVAWDSSTCAKRSELVDAHGNVIDFTKYPKTVKEWLDKYKIKEKDGNVILYKGTNENYKTQKDTTWIIGKTTIALDWSDTENIECGYGLHFCHHPVCCEQFMEVKHYLACEIQIKDIRIYNNRPEYPDKIRAMSAKVLYECDRWGEKLNKTTPKRDSQGRFCKP